MAVPKYNELMLPLLEIAGDATNHHIRDIVPILANHFQLTEADQSELLPSGQQTRFENRVNWAKSHLLKAGLVENEGRGIFHITERGVSVLNSNLSEISPAYLKRFSEYVEFLSPSDREVPTVEVQESQQTPEELIEDTYLKLRKTLNDELLETVLAVSPRFFERLVLDLLLKMGYGSSLDSGQHTGQSGDGGIDGLIREDKLGLDTIYIQAKRYSRDNGVSRSDVQSFVGSLMGLGASKGVFITTSYFTQQTIEYAKNVKNAKVILIDGQQLATLMIEHNVGVAIQKVYEIKQVDENYFPNA
jgi:restriction system protein